MSAVSRISNRWRWAITIVVCIGVVASLGTWKFLGIKAVIASALAQPEHSETVETATPVPVDYKPSIKTLGVAVAPQQIILRNELAGYIAVVNAGSGVAVKKGQLLLQLDISEQQANLASAHARAELAQLVYQRNLNLQKSNYVSQEQLDTSRAQVDVIKAEIAGINSIINRRTIRAPFDGVLGIHQHEVGQYLAANSEIATLVGNSPQMWIDFSVPQFYGELAQGMTVQLRIIRSGTVVNAPPITAVVSAGNSVITAAARSRLYRAVVNERVGELMNNMSVEVEVPTGSSSPLMSVPATAIRSDTNGQYLFVLDRDSNGQTYRARRLALTTYGQVGESVYVDGLKPTDLVAAAGAFKLYPGVLVRTTTRASVNPAGGER